MCANCGWEHAFEQLETMIAQSDEGKIYLPPDTLMFLFDVHEWIGKNKHVSDKQAEKVLEIYLDKTKEKNHE